MTELEKNFELLDSLQFRWRMADGEQWYEVAAFCQGSALTTDNLDLQIEMGFLNQIAWTHKIELGD